MPSFFKKTSIVWVCVALLASIDAHAAASSWSLWADSSNGLPVVPAGAAINDPRIVVDTANNAIFISGIGTWKPGLGYPGMDNICRVWKGDLTTRTFTLLPQTGMGRFEVLDMIINKAGELVISGGWGTQGTGAGVGGDFFYFDATQQRWFAANYTGNKPNLFVHNMSMAPNGTIWGAGRWHDVYKSTDNGRTFTDINPHNTIPAVMWPMPDKKTVDEGATYGIFYDPNIQRIYAGTEVGGVLYSDDDGAHWDCLDPHYHGNNGTSTINEGYLGNVWGFGLSKTNELIINGYANVGTGAPGGTFGAKGQGLYHYNSTTKTDGFCQGFPAYLFDNQKYYDHIRTTADGNNFFEIERCPNVDVPGHGGIYTSADGINWTPFNTGIVFPQYVASNGHHNTNSEGALAVSGNDVFAATADGKIYWYNTGSVAAVAPGITSQPANQSVTAGQSASFSVTASGTAPLTYQWSKNNFVIVGATASSYTTPSTVMTDNGATFTVAVSNTAGTAASQPATLTVNAVVTPPGITTQPANQSVIAGQSASFSVTASGTAPLTYQWSENGTAILGATAATYTTPPTAIGDNGAAFSVTVANAAGSANSNAAILSVNAPPVITSQPTAAPNPATAGQTVTFSVSASDPNGAALTYTWTFGDGTTGSGAIATHAYALAGSYSVNVKVTDTINLSVMSNSIAVTVNTPAAAAPTITKLTPNTGPNGPWGAYVAITGTNFATSGTVSVTFGGKPAPYVSVSSSTVIHVYTPAHASGVVDVTVTNPNSQAVTIVGGYTFL